MPKRKEQEPLRPVVFAMLTVLNEDSLHGYGIMKEVNEQMRRRAVLGPGTLYRTLKELRDEGLIEYGPSPSGADARRRYYRITDEGRRVARAEAERMAAWVDLAKRGRLLEGGGAG